MKEFIDKLIGRLEEHCSVSNEICHCDGCCSECDFRASIEIVNELAAEYKDKDCSQCSRRKFYQQGYEDAKKEYINTSTEYINSSIGGWIPCSERLPEAEERVLIFAKRKYKGGGFRNIITTAIYEDGTVLENDSNWHWEDIDGEWDEEEDCYIIPEGWWEDKQYNPDGVLNYAVDDKVVAWMPLPEPYTVPPTSAWKEQTMNRFERVE